MKSKTFKMFPCDVSKLRKNMIKTKMKQMQKKNTYKNTFEDIQSNRPSDEYKG